MKGEIHDKRSDKPIIEREYFVLFNLKNQIICHFMENLLIFIIFKIALDWINY